MMTFRRGLRDVQLPLSTVWLLNDIAEAKGKQQLYVQQSPQLLEALREMAMVQSVESSNRIESVTVAPESPGSPSKPGCGRGRSILSSGFSTPS